MVQSKRRGKIFVHSKKYVCLIKVERGCQVRAKRELFAESGSDSFGKTHHFTCMFFQVFVYASQNRVSFLVNVEVLIVLQSPEAFNYPIQREWLDPHVSGKNVFLSNQSGKLE